MAFGTRTPCQWIEVCSLRRFSSRRPDGVAERDPPQRDQFVVIGPDRNRGSGRAEQPRGAFLGDEMPVMDAPAAQQAAAR